MPRASKSFIAFALLVTIASQVMAADQTVIVVEGNKLPKVKVNDLLRFTASGAAGRTEMTININGSAKLVSTTKIRRSVDGNLLLGADTKEFLVQVTGKNGALIEIVSKDTVDRTTKKQGYELSVE